MRQFIEAYQMGNLIVAVLGSLGYSNALGKKGTSTDITLYDLKKGEDTVTFIEPKRYPERLAPLFYAASAAKKAIIIVEELNATFGECAVMLKCCGIESGYVVLKNYLPREKVEPLLRNAGLEEYEYVEDNPAFLREQFLLEAANQTATEPSCEAGGSVAIDHAFNVKGVGTVALGVVKKGEVRKHGEMRVLPGEKTAQIRSIQKHDDDFDSAREGDRVGLALKNVEVEDLDRGVILTTDSSVKISKELNTQVSLVKYWQTPLKGEMVLHLGNWMQFVPCKVESVSDNTDWRKPILTLTMESPLVHRSGDQAVVTYLEGGKLRVAGTALLP